MLRKRHGKKEPHHQSPWTDCPCYETKSEVEHQKHLNCARSKIIRLGIRCPLSDAGTRSAKRFSFAHRLPAILPSTLPRVFWSRSQMLYSTTMFSVVLPVTEPVAASVPVTVT
jgi:hypothetical protein